MSQTATPTLSHGHGFRMTDERYITADELAVSPVADYEEIGQWLGHRVVRHERAALTLGLATDGSGLEVRALLDQVDPGRTAVRSFAVHAASLDDVFLALTGHCATQPSSLEEESAHV